MFFVKIFVLSAFLSIFQVKAQEGDPATVFYVKTDGSDANDGSSWENAFGTVQHGINEAFAHNGKAEVWVSSGTYYPTEALSNADGQQEGDVYKSIIMYDGVNVYGGFEGTETTKEIGVQGGRQLTSDGENWDFANPTILDGEPTSSYHVVWFGSNGFGTMDYQGLEVRVPHPLDNLTILDGFTITGGFANMNILFENTDDSKKNFVHCAGGGVAVFGNGELHNCIVENNKAKYGGAGVAMFDGAKINNCLIQENEAIGVNFFNALLDPPLFTTFNYWRTDGAGVVALGTEDNNCVIENTTIHDNLGRANDNYPNEPSSSSNKFNNGGGVYLVYSKMTNTKVSSNNIVNNPHPYDGNAAASCGGGVYMFRNALVEDCEITDNGFLTTAQNAAGVYIADYVENATDYDELVIRKSYIHSNRAGGAVAVDAQYSTIENSIVANNQGAGIYGYGNCKRSRTINCVIYNNQSNGWVHSDNANNQMNSIINSTIVNNGNGIVLGNSNDHMVSNCIVWGNNSNSPTINTNATVQHSAFSFTPPSGTGNIELDSDNELGPKFENPTSSHGVNVGDWQLASWKLQESSPCIDSGDDSLIPENVVRDIEDNQRIIGCGIDMGAYESSFSALEVELAINSNSNFPVTDLHLCTDESLVFSFESASSGSYPYSISWTVNNNTAHPSSGNGIVVTNEGQELLNQVLESGQYELEVTSIQDEDGCFAILSDYTASISVGPVFEAVQDDIVLSVIAEDATFEWVDCENNFEPIAGAVNDVFEPQSNGTYAVIVTQNGCSDMSECFVINSLQTQNVDQLNTLIYPNPNDGEFNFETDKSVKFSLYNPMGVKVFERDYQEGTHHLDFKEFCSGVYFVVIEGQMELISETMKVVIR